MKELRFATETFGDPLADIRLLQLVDDHDRELIGQEMDHLRGLTGGKNFCLATIKVDRWEQDLSPWLAPAVFGQADFGDGAAATLEYLLQKVIPGFDAGKTAQQKLFVGGYSLAGLFALWAGYRTDVFDGIAAASPSVWFPGFTEFMRANRMRAGAVYLSLGDKEERTRNPVMAQVGNAIREAEKILKDGGKDCLLEWNQGNHFREPDLRTAKAFAWLMNRETRG